MNSITETAYVGPEKIMEDWDVSRATAYSIIRKLNRQLLKEHPTALIIAGKVNRIWYEKSCLIQLEKERRSMRNTAEQS